MVCLICFSITCCFPEEYVVVEIHNASQDTLYFQCDIAPSKAYEKNNPEYRTYRTTSMLYAPPKDEEYRSIEKIAPDSIYLDLRYEYEKADLPEEEDWRYVYELYVYNKDSLMKWMKDENQKRLWRDTISYSFRQLRQNNFKIEYTERSYKEQKRFK